MSDVSSQGDFRTAQVEGFRRSNGDVGVRNNVLVLPSVICSHIVADRIAEAVDGAVSAPHDHGCAQLGDDNEQTANTLVNVARNPNVAAGIVVGLGCEHVQSDMLADQISEHGVPIRELSIQDSGGSEETIAEGTRAVEEFVSETASTATDTVALSDLTVGVVSSDLHASTRDTADPLVGSVVDTLIDAGARVAVAGTERLAPHLGQASQRSDDPETANTIQNAVERYANQPGRDRGVVRQAMNQSFDSITRAWGTSPIEEFVSYGDRATVEEGLVIVDSPSRFEEATTALAAAGASIVVHVTAEGVSTGHPVVPVVKITGDESTAVAMDADIDLDGTKSTTTDVIDELVQVASGTPSAAEVHGLTEFAITRVGPSM